MKWGLLIFFIFCLGVELFIQNLIRQHLFNVSYRLTPNPGCALKFFGLIMFPGTLLHEVSHLASALILGSRVSTVSLKPRYAENGFIELGSVVAKDVGAFRNAIISIAPMGIGSGLILLVGWLVFDLPAVAAAVEVGASDQVIEYLTNPLGTLWGWLGAYVIIIVSMNMFPSLTDLQNAIGLIFLPIFLLVVLAILYLTQSAILSAFVEFTNSALTWLSIVLIFTVLLSVPVLFILRVLTHK